MFQSSSSSSQIATSVPITTTITSSTSPPTAGYLDEQYNVFSNDGLEVFFTGHINTRSMGELVKEMKRIETKVLKSYHETIQKIKKCIDSDSFDTNNYIGIKKEAELYLELKPIQLHIHSPGGSVFDAWYAIDIISNIKLPIHTIVNGFCASAGTLLSLVGKKRLIGSHATMLIHEIRCGVWGKKTELDEQMDNINKVSKQLMDYYITRTKLTQSQLDDILKKDVFWSPQECIDAGLVHEIV